MKKSLIALTLAALPVAAMANVTLYGAIKAGVQTYRSVEHTNGKVSKVETGSEIADFGSKIGFKGQEDLGNGGERPFGSWNKVPPSPALTPAGATNNPSSA